MLHDLDKIVNTSTSKSTLYSKKFNYKTIMLKHHNDLHIFYKYNNNIGFVPAEINFTHKKNHTKLKIL